jgi:Cu/Ag efflux pump CusA
MLGDLEGNPDPIEVKIFGEDSSVLADLAETLQPKLEKIEGIVDVVGPSAGAPEITWKIDPIAAGRLGLTVQQVSDQLANAWSGTVTTELRQADRSIPVRVRYPDSYRFDEAKLSASR